MPSKPKTTVAKGEAKPALVPKLRFPEFREAEDWKEKPLGKYLRESRIPGSKGNIARKITVKLWGNGVFEKKEAVQGSINTQYFRRRAGQFIYSKLDFLNQAFGIVPEALDGYESTVDLPCFDISEGLNPVFLLEYVKRKDFYERVGEAADGSRKAKRIQVETFLACQAALPTPAEQQKIAECLSSVDEAIAAQARKLDALKTHKKGLMQQLFPREGETQPRLRFPEFQNAGEWEESTVDEIILSVTPPKKLQTSDYKSSGQYPIIDQSQDYICGWTDDADAVIDQGMPVIVFGDHTCALKFVDQPFVQGADGIKIMRPKRGIDTRFLFCALEADPVVQETYKRHFSVLKEKRIRFPDPKSNEQQCIATCLSSLDALIAAGTQKHTALRRHKRGLMQQLFPSPEEVEA